MAHVLLLTDTQLERICERSEGLCGNDCRRCEAFQANMRYNDGYREDDFDDDDDEIFYQKFGIFKITSYICTVITSGMDLITRIFTVDSTRDSRTALHYTKDYPYLAPSLLDRDFRIL